MKRILLFFSLVVLCVVAMAQTGYTLVAGRITSGSKGVPYAMLQLRGTSIGVQCNDAGYYEFRIPSQYDGDTVEIRSMGYDNKVVTVAALRKNANVRLIEQAVVLKEVVVSDFASPRKLLNEAVSRIAGNYTNQTSYPTFFFRNWRAVDDELYLFDEAVILMRRAPYSRFIKKQAYLLDPESREMATNYKQLLRHRLVVLDSSLLYRKTGSAAGVWQRLEYADNEIFFDPVSTPQASFALSDVQLKSHLFEPIREFESNGEEYYVVRSVGPSRMAQRDTRYEYIIRKSDLAIVRITSSQKPTNRRAPQEMWVNFYFSRIAYDTDSSSWSYDVRDDKYTLTHYYNTKRRTLSAIEFGHNGESQTWQDCVEWTLTDFTMQQAKDDFDTIPVHRQTLSAAFGSSDYRSDFWGHYNAMTLDADPARLLYEKLSHAAASRSNRTVVIQEPEPQDDSIAIRGVVVSRATGKPEPFCKITLWQQDSVKALAMGNQDGIFDLGKLLPGTYSLEASVLGVSLVKKEVELTENANLRVTVDTVRLVYLSTVTINGKRHVIALPPHKLKKLDLEISSPADPRLWDFTYRPWMALWNIPPHDGSASNAEPFGSTGVEVELEPWR